MELRFQTARTTKDLDFTVRVAPAGTDDVRLKEIQDAGAVDLGDFFSFRVGETMMDLDGALAERAIRWSPSWAGALL